MRKRVKNCQTKEVQSRSHTGHVSSEGVGVRTFIVERVGDVWSGKTEGNEVNYER